ncbi:MAG: histidine kinase [Actinomycetota bacterium]|nr:histidine kinase [Actinomycetota bacterium]
MNLAATIRRDAVIPAILLVFTLWEMSLQGRFGGPLVVHLLDAVIANAALVFRRHAPLTAVVVVAATGAVAAVAVVPAESAGAFLTVLLATYSIACHTDGRRRAAGTLALAIAIGVHLSQDPLTTSIGEALPTVLIAAFAWTAGLIVRLRADEAVQHGRRAEQLEASRAAAVRAAAEAERSRIARELHDIIAHNLSTIVVQAGAERLDGQALPERAEATLTTIEDTARQTLDEMRRLLGLLRKGPAGDVRGPQPRLAHLDHLADQVASAGLPVEVRREGEVRPLPDGLELSGFRIVQEALTNALKHAGPARAQVAVRYAAGELVVRVADTGRGHRGGAGDGHGLIGIRERVELYGGELTTGNQPQGGFAVEARFPAERST